ncbi:hypothetical protein PDESU_02940 [Pontiella desulfatans]|uniref:Uncharacterized protein n=1 Tax=Pontiella desulfatans TaxID=2750659 RepID=A0A6C2U3K5_PONDE|nr:hypothetical protein [Pontiella desulfatans]VGO14379.1 hypothetical protein PDESU_02940 [Pontiella desulfatans]
MKTATHRGIRSGFLFTIITTLALFAGTYAFAQGTAFTYQGQLDDAGVPANGNYDIRFSVWNASSGGSQLAGPTTYVGVPVGGGLFTVQLDFGSSVFSGADRWLEIGVQTNGGGGFTTLAPRTKFTSTPYAIQAITAAGVPAGAIGSSEVVNESLTSSDLGPNSVGTSEVIDNSLQAVDLAPNSVYASEIGTDAVGASEIAAGAVGTAEIADANVYAVDLANDNGSLSKVTSGTMTDSGTTIGINTTTPDAVLDVYGTAYISSTTDGIVNIGNSAGFHLTLDNNELHGRNGTNPSDLYLNDFGGDVYIGQSTLRVDTDQDDVYVVDRLTAGYFVGNGSGLNNIGTAAVADGSLTTDDLNLTSVDARYVEVAGDTMTGDLLLSSAGNSADLYINNDYPFIFLDSDSGNAGLSFKDNGTYTGWLYVRATDNVLAMSAGAESGVVNDLTIHPDGRVGVGRVATAAKFEVEGDVDLYDTDIDIYATDGSKSVMINGDTAGAVYLYNTDGDLRQYTYASTYGYSYYYNDTGNSSIYISGDVYDGGYMRLENAAGSSRVLLYGDYLGTGDGRVITDELQINGGSDLSEQFDIDGHSSKVEPGMIVCIDADNPGKLVVSGKAYDRTVAGIVSGADGVKPGLLMQQEGTVASGEYPVALTGRVYCKADASQAAIEPGDLITTSDLPGHGMKVDDPSRAHGAIIGKAMTGLESGQGLVLVLVSLH